jgi:hypothetical protein
MASDDVASNICPTVDSGTTRSESLDTEEESPDKRWHRSEAGPCTLHSFRLHSFPLYFFLVFSNSKIKARWS